MKKLFAITFAISLFLLSCKKNDTTAPVITILGGNSMTISLPSMSGANTWSAPTVTAQDDQDGDISNSITASADPNVNAKGAYTVTYTATDNSGNQAQAVLTVNVVNDAEAFAGTYNVHDTVPTIPAYNYTMTISTDNSINNKIHFNSGQYNTSTVGFACYQNNYTVYAFVTGNAVTLPSQTVGPIGTDNSTHDFNGSGPVSSTNPLTFSMTYTDHDQTNSSTASGCVQTYIHQ